ncbi:unnamed protein product [Meganyctiphanes norvegica]|uniref:Gustatory receptor n=1 Tax=Meganyctiphanes norvegica TaxID=48144 RepID=A0AAV2QJI9_MEGNR
MDIPEINFLRENRKSFVVFRFFGLLPSMFGFDKRKWRPYLRLFRSRLFWFIWHVAGTGLGIWNWYTFVFKHKPHNLHYKQYDISITLFNTIQMTKCSDVKIKPSDKIPKTNLLTSEESLQYNELLLSISGLIFVLMVIGPLQSNVIKRNMDFFPRILKNIRKLEKIQLPKKIHKIFSEREEERYLLHNVDADTSDGEDNEEDNIEVGRRGHCLKNCYDTNWLPRISIGIFMTIFLGCFCFAVYHRHNMESLIDEWKLILMVFFLPLPVLTTWFCIVLIKQISTMYNELYDLKPEAFRDSNEMKRISDYITILQRTSQIMRNEIFEFTIGMNFILFVAIGIVSVYEILQGFQDSISGTNENQYSKIDYMFPLLISIICIYMICSACDNLITNGHERLLLRMKEFLSYQLFVRQIRKGDPHKKIKHLYENLKDWPPQVYIYGGWKVDFQLFVATLIFMYTYAKLIYDL